MFTCTSSFYYNSGVKCAETMMMSMLLCIPASSFCVELVIAVLFPRFSPFSRRTVTLSCKESLSVTNTLQGLSHRMEYHAIHYRGRGHVLKKCDQKIITWSQFFMFVLILKMLLPHFGSCYWNVSVWTWRVLQMKCLCRVFFSVPA